MVGDPALGKLVGADRSLRIPVPTWLRRWLARASVCSCLAPLPEPGAQNAQGRSLFLYWLRSSWHSHHRAGGNVGDPDGGLCLVDGWPPPRRDRKVSIRSSEGLQLKLHLIHLGQHRHGGGGGVDSPPDSVSGTRWTRWTRSHISGGRRLRGRDGEHRLLDSPSSVSLVLAVWIKANPLAAAYMAYIRHRE